ncbi:MAG: hypothetical protein M5U28_12865 [Sandaracinaceae bacterium]|nr:hypothetical protein [Sandaracinaceae bacterium]
MALLARLALARHARREHRVERERHPGRDDGRAGDGEPELAEELPDDAAREGDGHEDRAERGRGRDHRQGDLPRALLRGGDRVLAALEVLHDVLADDDRVVDQEADRQRETQEGHHVEAEVEQPHQEERADDGGRQREAADEGAPQIEEEHEDDEDGHRAAEEERDLDLVRVLHDELGLIDDHRGGDPLGHGQLGEAVAHALGHLDGVRARRLQHLEDDRRLAALAHDGGLVGEAVLDLRHVAQAHDRAARAGADGQLAQLLDAPELANRAHGDPPLALVEAAAGDGDVLHADAIRDGHRRHAEGLHPVEVEQDVHLPLAPADHADAGHPSTCSSAGLRWSSA